MDDTNNRIDDYLEDVRDKIISEELEKRISWIETDLNNRLDDNPLASRFTQDKSTDIAFIVNTLNSFKLVKKYFEPM
jgi:hypothetical protein